MIKFLIGILLSTFSLLANASNGTVLIVLPSVYDVEANLTTKLQAAGYTVATSAGVPADPQQLSTYKQIWDIRINTVLSSGDKTAYKTYLQAGGALFLLGENEQEPYLSRDNSFIDLAVSAGASPVTSNVVSPAVSQTVNAPFNASPNALTTVQFFNNAGINTSGLGSASAVTVDSAGLATAIAWKPGSMTQAPTGTIVAVFDVNPLIGTTLQGPFIANLIAYLAAPSGGNVEPASIPTLNQWAMIFLASLMALFAFARTRRQ